MEKLYQSYSYYGLVKLDQTNLIELAIVTSSLTIDVSVTIAIKLLVVSEMECPYLQFEQIFQAISLTLHLLRVAYFFALWQPNIRPTYKTSQVYNINEMCDLQLTNQIALLHKLLTCHVNQIKDI